MLAVHAAAAQSPSSVTAAAPRVRSAVNLSACLQEDLEAGVSAAVVRPPLLLSYESGRTSGDWVDRSPPLLVTLAPRDDSALDRLLGDMGETLKADEAGDLGGVAVRVPGTASRALLTVLTETFTDPRQNDGDQLALACHMACWITEAGHVKELGGWIDPREWRQSVDAEDPASLGSTQTTQAAWTIQWAAADLLVGLHLTTHRTTARGVSQSRRMVVWRIRGAASPAMMLNDLYQRDESFGPQGSLLSGGGGYAFHQGQDGRWRLRLSGMSSFGPLPERIWVYDGERLEAVPAP